MSLLLVVLLAVSPDAGISDAPILEAGQCVSERGLFLPEALAIQVDQRVVSAEVTASESQAALKALPSPWWIVVASVVALGTGVALGYALHK